MPVPTLESERLILRPLTEADLPAVFAYASDPEVTRYMLFETHADLADTRFFLEELVFPGYAEGIPSALAICERGAPEWALGTISLNWRSEENREMELAYALARPRWGQGIVSEAAALMRDFAFAHFPVERLMARCAVENVGSAKIMARIGMRHEGTHRHVVFRRGSFVDHHVYAILREEWEALQAA